MLCLAKMLSVANEGLLLTVKTCGSLPKANTEWSFGETRHRKAGTVASIFFGFGERRVLGVIKEGLVSLIELREPTWKKMSQLKCAPGGVVYQFNEALR
jgi:hypothetical protein